MTMAKSSNPKPQTQPLLYAFDEFFTKEIPKHPSNPKAFEAAADRFEERHGFIPPFTYDGFRKQKLNALRKKK